MGNSLPHDDAELSDENPLGADTLGVRAQR